ncbi:hypothetical protein V6Z11_1Z031300 [Gossypium hirsutum]
MSRKICDWYLQSDGRGIESEVGEEVRFQKDPLKEKLKR